MTRLTILLLCLLGQAVLAQSSSKYALLIGYFGDRISNAGAVIGIENSLLQNERLQLIGAGEVGGFQIPGNSQSLFGALRIGPRYTVPFGLFMESFLTIGYQQVFYRYDRFRMDDAGNVVRQNPNTSGRAMPGVAVGIGYDWSRKTKLNLKVFGGLQVYFNYPTTHILFESSNALRAGVLVSPGFLNRKR